MTKEPVDTTAQPDQNHKGQKELNPQRQEEEKKDESTGHSSKNAKPPYSQTPPSKLTPGDQQLSQQNQMIPHYQSQANSKQEFCPQSQTQEINQQQKEERKRILINKAPFLEIKIIEGNAISDKHLIQINAFGLIGESKRENSDDHFIYFGSAQELKGKVINDVICSKEDDFSDQHFYIRYDKIMNQYFVRDCGKGSGTFLRVLTQQSYSMLRNGQIVIFGENQMVIGITHGQHRVTTQEKNGTQGNEEDDVIVMKFIDGPKKNQQFQMKSQQAPIFIGRTAKCLVRFNDTSLSRQQCVIDFIDDKWFIRDGDGLKESTNGTWLFADEEVKLANKSVIKAGKSLFQVTMI